MESQNQQPITHTEQPATTPVRFETPQFLQYWVTLPEVILAVATLTGAMTELVRVLRGKDKKK